MHLPTTCHQSRAPAERKDSDWGLKVFMRIIYIPYQGDQRGDGMYVCICRGVTDNAIREAVEDGARSWREVRERTECATQCGRCACTAKAITRDAITQEMMPSEDLAYAV